MLNFHPQSFKEQLFSLDELKTKLGQLAALSLIEDQAEKDSLIHQLYQFRYQLNIDPVAGGYYSKLQTGTSPFIHFSANTNLNLAELFLHSGVALLNGDFIHAGQRLLEAVYHHLWCSESGYFLSGKDFEFESSIFSLPGGEILELLELSEQNLLLALMTPEAEPVPAIIEYDKRYQLCHRRSLMHAAEAADLNLKHAQILQITLLDKIASVAKFQPKQTLSTNSSIDGLANGRILSLLIFDYLWNRQAQHLARIQELSKRIKTQLEEGDATKDYSTEQLATLNQLIRALISASQIELVVDCWPLIVKRNQHGLAFAVKSENNHLADLFSTNQRVLQTLGLLADTELLNRDNFRESDKMETFDVKRLSGDVSASQNERQRYFSQYNPKLLVFPTS